MTPERGPEGLRVGAITSFTTIDFPGKLAAVAFIQGCPWDCTYCQNPWLRPFKFDPQYEHESWVAVHTSGAYPAVLKEILPDIDWVGLDIKAPLTDPAAFRNIIRVGAGEEKTLDSLDILKASGVPFECRTTCHPAFLSEEQLLGIGVSLAAKGVKSYALQPFRVPPGFESESLYPNCPPDYPSPELQAKLRSLFPQFAVRR